MGKRENTFQMEKAAKAMQSAWMGELEQKLETVEAEPSEALRQKVMDAQPGEKKTRSAQTRVFRRVAAAAVLALVLLAFSGHFIQAEVRSWFSFSNRPESNGLIYKIGADYNLGPDDFTVLSDNRILFLNSADHSVYMFQNEKVVRQYYLLMKNDPSILAVKGEKAYIPDTTEMIELNLETGNSRKIPLSQDMSVFGLTVFDLVWDEDKLVIVTEQGTNYVLNEEESIFEKTEAGYTIQNEEDTSVVSKGKQVWIIPGKSLKIRPIGFETNGDIIVSVVNPTLDKKDAEYCMICRYSKDGTCLAASSIAAGKWNHSPRCFAHWEKDDTVFVLSPYVDNIILSSIKLGTDNVTDEKEAEPDTPVPKESIPNPTGFADGEIQIACIFYNGTLWTEFLSGLPVRESLPEDEYKLAGNILREDNIHIPSEELVAAHFKEGTAVYISADGKKLYVRMGENRYVGLIPYEEMRK